MNLNRETDVLVLGMESVGKSLLIKSLVRAANDKKKSTDQISSETNPTVGFDTNKLKVGGRELYVNEVGSSMISNWYKFM